MSSAGEQDSSPEGPQVLPIGVVGQLLLRHWLVLALGLVLGGVAGFGISRLVPPTYSATATQLVKGVPGSGVAANYEAAQFAVSRARSYPSFIFSQDVLSGVAADLGTTDLTDLRDSLSATNPSDTPLVQITATGRTAEEAQRKANFAATRMAAFITKIETVAGKTPVSVETAVQALLPESPSDPRPMLYAAVGASLGLVVAIIFAIASYFASQRTRRPGRRQRRAPAPSDDLLDSVGADSSPSVDEQAGTTVDERAHGEPEANHEMEVGAVADAPTERAERIATTLPTPPRKRPRRSTRGVSAGQPVPDPH